MENIEVWVILTFLWNICKEWGGTLVAGLCIVGTLILMREIHKDETRDMDSKTHELAYGLLMITSVVFVYLWGWKVVLFGMFALSVFVLRGYEREAEKKEIIKSIDAVKREIQALREERRVVD